MKIFNGIRQDIAHFYNTRTENREERVRLTVFIVSMTLTLCAMPLHFLGAIGIDIDILKDISWLTMGVSAIALMLYISRRWSLELAFSLSCVACAALEAAKIVIITIMQPAGASHALMLNAILLFTTLLYCVLGYLRLAPVIVTGLLVSALTFACFYPSGSVILDNQFWLLFVILAVVTCAMAAIARRAMHAAQKESTEYRDLQIAIFRTFGVTRRGLLDLIHDWHNNKNDDLDGFFNNIDPAARTRIITAAINQKANDEARNADLGTSFPQLSDTELTICRYIIARKTKKQIASALNKSENNVGSVRSNIRRKLGLDPKQDLRQFLIDNSQQQASQDQQ